MGDDVIGKPQTLLQSIGQRYAAEKLRAQERLKTYGRHEWNFAIVGLDCDLTIIDLGGLAAGALPRHRRTAAIAARFGS